MRLNKAIFDRSLIYEASGKDKLVNLERRGKPISEYLPDKNTILDEVEFIAVPPSREDYVLPTGEVISNPDYDAFIPLTEEQLEYVEMFFDDNDCIPIQTGDTIERSMKNGECKTLHILRIDFANGWILLDVEQEGV